MRTKELTINNKKITTTLFAGGPGFKIYGHPDFGFIVNIGRKYFPISENSPEDKIVANYVNLKYQNIKDQERIKNEFDALVLKLNTKNNPYEVSTYKGDNIYHIDTTGDACVGDEVKFEMATFTGSHSKPKFNGFVLIEAKIINDSYGKDKQQHTFTLLHKDGTKQLIKGRNLYRNGLFRKPWKDENERNKTLEEKHLRGSIARSVRYERKNNPSKDRLMKKEIEIDSKEGKKDLLDFFQKKFPSLSKKEIKDQIEESLDDNGRYSSYGTCYKVEVDGEEFNLVPSFDTFHDIAIDYVTQMLEDEPELFTQSWLESHLYITDTDKRLIAGDEAEAYSSGLRDRDIAEEYENKHGELLYEVEPDEEEGEEGELDYDKMREEIYDSHYDYVYGELERDAVGYFTDNLGYPIEDLMKNNLFSIDIGAAAEDAVQTDGEAHFLSHYDGNYEETNGGIIVMKE